MCHKTNPISAPENVVEQVLPDSLHPHAKSDKTKGLTRQEPLALDRADTYTDLYNMPQAGGEV